MRALDASPVLAIVGATATGKTALAESLAEELRAEILCADSRQVFRELEIGTGKPAPDERAARPHHLFDALSLEERATAGWYGRESARVREEARGRGALPLLVGGSGLYLRAAERGLAPAPPRHAATREELLRELAARGPEALHARLAEVDPTAARRIAPRDRQRIVRALEVERVSGQPLSWWLEQPPAAPLEERWLLLELTLPAETLKLRIAARTRWMMSHGLPEEVRTLVERGREPALRELRAVGYDETLDLLAGTIDQSEAEARIDRRTLQLAKRQRTWFRHQIRAHAVDARLPLASQRVLALDLVRRELERR